MVLQLDGCLYSTPTRSFHVCNLIILTSQATYIFWTTAIPLFHALSPPQSFLFISIYDLLRPFWHSVSFLSLHRLIYPTGLTIAFL